MNICENISKWRLLYGNKPENIQVTSELVIFKCEKKRAQMLHVPKIICGESNYHLRNLRPGCFLG